MTEESEERRAQERENSKAENKPQMVKREGDRERESEALSNAAFNQKRL